MKFQPSTTPTQLAFAFVASTCLAHSAALAGEGHDHGDAPTTVAGPALPRFTAASETFELVGVLNGKQLRLYLDRFADNSPVKDATLELEIGGAKLAAVPHAEGEFEAVLAEAPPPGVLPVTATVIAGTETDLLVGEIDIHADAPAAAAAQPHGWQALAAWGAGGVLLLGALAWLGRRAMVARPVRTGAAA